MHPWVEIGGAVGLLETLLMTRQSERWIALAFVGLVIGEMGVSAAVAILGLVSGNESEILAGVWGGTGVIVGACVGASVDLVISMARGNFKTLKDEDAWLKEEWKVEDWDWPKNSV